MTRPITERVTAWGVQCSKNVDRKSIMTSRRLNSTRSCAFIRVAAADRHACSAPAPRFPTTHRSSNTRRRKPASPSRDSAGRSSCIAKLFERTRPDDSPSSVRSRPTRWARRELFLWLAVPRREPVADVETRWSSSMARCSTLGAAGPQRGFRRPAQVALQDPDAVERDVLLPGRSTPSSRGSAKPATLRIQVVDQTKAGPLKLVYAAKLAADRG